MDGQNMGNEQNRNNERNDQPARHSYYQDNTANIPYQTPIDDWEPNKVNSLQVVGLVCGIAGILCCCVGIGILFGIIGLVCAILGNKQGRTGVGTGGFVCSIIAIIFNMISSFVLFAIFIAALKESGGFHL